MAFEYRNPTNGDRLTSGQPDADVGTVLAAVLRALRIEAPTAEDEQAYILCKRQTA
ncbi:hypothetical protein ACIQMY_25465 [Streptomyces sp. NPDC091368]|uniref:hypothetical protein n=1 Tax=Streptomyces sp. NPDC091368 TaxID=3365993 RepID=UPI00382C13B7